MADADSEFRRVKVNWNLEAVWIRKAERGIFCPSLKAIHPKE
jgi:hypothetical protein